MQRPALPLFHRLVRPLALAGMFVMFLPFGVLVGVGKALKLLAPFKDAI